MQTSIFNAAIFHLIFLLLPIAMGTIHCFWRRNHFGFSKIECFLTYFLVISVGIESLLVGYCEIFQPSLVVEYAGWAPSPFLNELGIAHISFGLLGVLSYWFSNGWRAAAGFGFSSYLLMTGFSHIRAAYFTHVYELSNFGPTLISDFGIPLCVFTLLILRKLKK